MKHAPDHTLLANEQVSTGTAAEDCFCNVDVLWGGSLDICVLSFCKLNRVTQVLSEGRVVSHKKIVLLRMLETAS
eukprot:CAMPEP_0194509912 /NCGR_PEP_ID=MMETSP0253-20130528/41126_1 /TAXON_ID=2966 /ORGANISM="Noctiluca scintillans" /LENGTH=74 /DNA_ID=CAMNT_0039353115 /DNA_START=133 /DNA_END=357 /DNA_ORIENTATION=-